MGNIIAKFVDNTKRFREKINPGAEERDKMEQDKVKKMADDIQEYIQLEYKRMKTMSKKTLMDRHIKLMMYVIKMDPSLAKKL